MFKTRDYNIVKLLYHGLHLDIKRKNTNSNNGNILRLLNKLIRSVISGKIYMPRKQNVDHFFYLGTRNQHHALSKIRQHVLTSSLTYYHGNDLSLKDVYSQKYPFWIAHVFGLCSNLLFWKTRNKINKRLKIINPNLYYGYDISVLLGEYFLSLLMLKLTKPKYLWMSNDHTHINVAFIYASKKLNIKSVYLQHASVSSIFPPLNFNFAFLDGSIAFNVYRKIGIAGTKVFLSGMPKMDGFIKKYQMKASIETILVCINQEDSLSKFEVLINCLIDTGYNVKVRKHPYLTNKLEHEENLRMSDEPLFMDSLDDVDLVIAGDSNVHLEATLSNIPCFYLSSSKHFDYYGFFQNGLVLWGGRDLENCLKQVRDYKVEEDVYLRAKPYCASVGTDFENKSTTFILDKLGINDK